MLSYERIRTAEDVQVVPEHLLISSITGTG